MTRPYYILSLRKRSREPSVSYRIEFLRMLDLEEVKSDLEQPTPGDFYVRRACSRVRAAKIAIWQQGNELQTVISVGPSDQTNNLRTTESEDHASVVSKLHRLSSIVPYCYNQLRSAHHIKASWILLNFKGKNLSSSIHSVFVQILSQYGIRYAHDFITKQ